MFKLTNSTKLNTVKRVSKYEALEEIVRQRIRYFLADEKKTYKLSLDQVHSELTKVGFEITKSKTKEWLQLEEID